MPVDACGKSQQIVGYPQSSPITHILSTGIFTGSIAVKVLILWQLLQAYIFPQRLLLLLN
jgi:hypothetical protein